MCGTIEDNKYSPNVTCEWGGEGKHMFCFDSETKEGITFVSCQKILQPLDFPSWSGGGRVSNHLLACRRKTCRSPQIKHN